MKTMVTGGGGFLGSNLVKALIARGDSVRVLARGDYPELRALGAETIRGDITDAAATAKACEGVDAVFHTAAKAGGWGNPKEYEAINVGGTDHVIAGCVSAKVPVLIHTSSPSIVHGHEDIEGANESLPYAAHFTAHYPRTKAIAEQHALAASSETLKVISLRPHFIWGPGDRHLLPRLIARAKTGRLRQIGSRDPKCDTIYIDNCVDAHLLAAEKLLADAALGGKPYFVSDDAPIGVWTMANRMLACAGQGPVGRPIPAGLAYAVGAMMEGTYWLFGVEKEPLITRFGASELSYAQWFDISAAKRDLGYSPKVTIDEGLKRLAESLKV